MAHGGTNLGYSLKGTRIFHFNISRSQLQPKGRTNTSQNSPTVCLSCSCTKKDDQKVIGSPFKGHMGRDIRCIGLIIKGPPSQGFSHHVHQFSLWIRVSWPVSTFYWLKKNGFILGGSSHLVNGLYPWLISPLRIGLWDPFQMAFPWIINDGVILTTYKSWEPVEGSHMLTNPSPGNVFFSLDPMFSENRSKKKRL